MNKQYVIYKTTNLINNKIYIGKDEYNNPEYFGSGKLLHQAIDKYGKENFRKEIIETCQTPKLHSLRETYWINNLPCLSPIGYNIAKNSWGGDTYTHHPNKIEYSIKLSKSHTGKKFSESHKQHIAETKFGVRNPSKRQDVKDKISESRRGKGLGEQNSMYNSERTKDRLNALENVELKGDRWEYLRNKIKCTNIETKEEFILDGVQEVLKKLKIPKNKYYTHIKTGEAIKNKFMCEKL